ncbi:MAG: hypothetical protein SynsKO_36520 [Synoicihabitans sp.]
MPEKTQLALAFLKTQPGAAAEILERQNPAEVAGFLASVPATRSAPVLARMLPRYCARLCESVTAEQSAALLSALGSGEIASILRHVKTDTAKPIIAKLPERHRLTLRIILSYAPETVGAWMTLENPVLPRDCSVQDGLSRIAEDPGEGEHELIPVVDREGRLVGEVTLRTLISSSDEVSVSSVMRPSLHTLRGRSNLENQSNHRGWQTASALPVVSREGKLLGVLRHIDLQRGLIAAAAAPEPSNETGILGQVLRAYAQSFVALTNTVFATDKR